jgi:hypothetical protein
MKKREPTLMIVTGEKGYGKSYGKNNLSDVKTVIEQLQTLGHPYRKQALENCKEHNKLKIASCKSDAVEEAFWWNDSPQGYDYWNTYWNKLCDKETTHFFSEQKKEI